MVTTIGVMTVGASVTVLVSVAVMVSAGKVIVSQIVEAGSVTGGPGT
jgi:hypothetical protein